MKKSFICLCYLGFLLKETMKTRQRYLIHDLEKVKTLSVVIIGIMCLH